MRIIVLASLLIMTASQAEPQDSAPRVVEAIFEEAGGELEVLKKSTLSKLTESDRNVLVQHYRSKMVEAKEQTMANPVFSFKVTELESALIELQDPEQISRIVKELKTMDVRSPEFKRSLRKSQRITKPTAVADLGDELLVDEPYRSKRSDGHEYVLSRSYILGAVVLRIVANSDEFSEITRKWANDNVRVEARRSLPSIKEWWKANRIKIVGGRYKEVLPGADIYKMETEHIRMLQRKKKEYFDDLVRQGKDPNNEANWSEWQKNLPGIISPIVQDRISDSNVTQRDAEVKQSGRRVPLYIGLALLALIAGAWLLNRRASKN